MRVKKLSYILKSKKRKKLSLRDGMSEALEELRTMRQEMEEMRKELVKLKQLQMGGEYVEEESKQQQQAAIPHPPGGLIKIFHAYGNSMSQPSVI